MTPEIAEARRGLLTASMAAVIMGDLKTDGLAKYISKLAGERVYGDLEEDKFKSAKMQDGNDCEPEALDWAEFHFDVPLIRQAHIVHPSIPYVAATLDALAPGFTVEAKSPLFHVWRETTKAKRVPAQYRWQCRWQLWCAQLDDCRFVTYHRKPGGFVIPFTVTTDEIQQMAERAELVESLIRREVEDIQQLRNAA